MSYVSTESYAIRQSYAIYRESYAILYEEKKGDNRMAYACAIVTSILLLIRCHSSSSALIFRSVVPVHCELSTTVVLRFLRRCLVQLLNLSLKLSYAGTAIAHRSCNNLKSPADSCLVCDNTHRSVLNTLSVFSAAPGIELGRAADVHTTVVFQ